MTAIPAISPLPTCRHCGDPIYLGEEAPLARAGRPPAHWDHTICFQALRARVKAAESLLDEWEQATDEVDALIEELRDRVKVAEADNSRLHERIAELETMLLEAIPLLGAVARMDEEAPAP